MGALHDPRSDRGVGELERRAVEILLADVGGGERFEDRGAQGIVVERSEALERAVDREGLAGGEAQHLAMAADGAGYLDALRSVELRHREARADRAEVDELVEDPAGVGHGDAQARDDGGEDERVPSRGEGTDQRDEQAGLLGAQGAAGISHGASPPQGASARHPRAPREQAARSRWRSPSLPPRRYRMPRPPIPCRRRRGRGCPFRSVRVGRA